MWTARHPHGHRGKAYFVGLLAEAICAKHSWAWAKSSSDGGRIVRSTPNHTEYVRGYVVMGTNTARLPATKSNGTSGTLRMTDAIIQKIMEPNVMKTPMVAAPSSKPSYPRSQFIPHVWQHDSLRYHEEKNDPLPPHHAQRRRRPRTIIRRNAGFVRLGNEFINEFSENRCITKSFFLRVHYRY